MNLVWGAVKQVDLVGFSLGKWYPTQLCCVVIQVFGLISWSIGGATELYVGFYRLASLSSWNFKFSLNSVHVACGKQTADVQCTVMFGSLLEALPLNSGT